MHNTTILGRLSPDHKTPIPPPKSNSSHQAFNYIPFDWLLPMYTKEAIDFIDTNWQEPFFLYYAPDCTHLPVYSSDRFQNSSIRGEYGDAVKEMDWSIGEIISTLEQLNISQNTMIFFASDNGPALYESLKNRTGVTTPGVRKDDVGSAGLLKGGKATTWDGGFRTPGIAWWPGVIHSGQASFQVSSILDLYPTIMEFAGIQLDSNKVYDGESLVQLLTSQQSEASPMNRTLFLYRGDTLFATRQNEYKAHFITWGEISVTVPHLMYYNGGPCSKHQQMENCNCTVQGNNPLLFHMDRDPSEKYPIDPNTDEYRSVMPQIEAATRHHKDTLHPATPEMNMCDPQVALWAPEFPVPPSKIGFCEAQSIC